MADIAMCKGDGCSRKENCYRYKAKPDEMMQSYLAEVPVDPTTQKCRYFWNMKGEQRVYT